MWKALRMIDDGLRHEILTLGLEDDIPIWEVAGVCRASGVIAQGTEGTEVLARGSRRPEDVVQIMNLRVVPAGRLVALSGW